MKVIHLFEQFDLSDIVITLVKLAIGIAERDDPNLVSCDSAQYCYWYLLTVLRLPCDLHILT